MTRHVRLRGWVEAYVDGELNGPRQAETAGHIDRCWTCSGHVETLRLIRHSLRTRQAPLPLSERRLRRFAERLATTTAPRSDH